jgi:hypothetical protein
MLLHKKHCESLSSDKKAQILKKDVNADKQQQEALSPEKNSNCKE